MIALDTNVIIHLLVRSQAEHPRAKAWFGQNDEPLATTSTNVGEVLRLLSHPRVFLAPLTLAKAVDLLKSFVEDREISVLDEAEAWWSDLGELARELPTVAGNEVFDARIALCLRHHGVRHICTLDDDFLKYPFLKQVKI
ncbi:MAG: PIN domain-containing protein [Deltaproteobacteria bacterium]|nr:PIN domain-containing protein [Deltaproteobacteria bacterium]